MRDEAGEAGRDQILMAILNRVKELNHLGGSDISAVDAHGTQYTRKRMAAASGIEAWQSKAVAPLFWRVSWRRKDLREYLSSWKRWESRIE